MGKAISVLGRRMMQPVKEFNLEQRVFKDIIKEKRKISPRHESTAQFIEESVLAQSSEVKRKLVEKDDLLVQRLKNVYVTSQDVKPQKPIQTNPERPLPSDRSFIPDPEYGYFEPRKVSYGKVTLRDIVHVITKHQEDPQLWTAKKLALEFRLDTGLLEKILHYFQTFVLIMPEDAKDTKINMSTLKTIPFTPLENLKQLTGPTGSERKAGDSGSEDGKNIVKS